MLTKTSYRKIVRASGIYDLLVTAPFATPFTFAPLDRLLRTLHETSGAGGSFPPFAPSQALLAHLLGSVVVVWSVLRIRTPEERFGRLDAVARWLFSAWMLWAVAHGASTVILAFVVFEVAFGIAQSLPVSRADETRALSMNAA